MGSSLEIVVLDTMSSSLPVFEDSFWAILMDGAGVLFLWNVPDMLGTI